MTPHRLDLSVLSERPAYAEMPRRRVLRAYLLDVETFQLMQQRMAILEGIARGEQAVAEGRVATHAQAKKRLSRWLK